MSLSPNYATEFRTWWESINPQWCLRCSGRLAIDGLGDWSTMAVPGVNGFINIIGGLLGFREVVEVNDWLEMLRDVGWVIVEVREAVKAHRYVPVTVAQMVLY